MHCANVSPTVTMISPENSTTPDSGGRIELHLDIAEANSKAVETLAAASRLSRQQVKQVMQKGAVWLTRKQHTQRLRRASKILVAGDQLHLYYNPQVLDQVPPAAQLLVDEGAYSLWYKPYGLFSQGSKWGDHCAIDRWAEQHLKPERPAFVVHRLDRAATGLMLLAHQKRSAKALSRLFENRQLTKTYRVVVHGHCPESDSPRTLSEPIDGRLATSHARLLGYNPDTDQSLLEVVIDTGRKHQIRRHLAGAGFPVVGDRLYGAAIDREIPVDLQLCAYSLQFSCPLSGIARHYRLPHALCPQL